MSYRYLNIHVLTSHSPSCLNRDDMNMQKSAVFGGSRRVRISSQSLKRAIRKSDYYLEHLGQPSVRTKKLSRLKAQAMNQLSERFDEATIVRTIELLTGKEGLPDSDTVAPYSIQEIGKVCEVVVQSQEDGVDEKALAKLIQKEYAPAIREAMGNTVDLALSGRMTTSGLMSSVEAAMALAHAMTTHEVDADIDWFTAVDDLTKTEEDDQERGSAHLGTQEFGSGTFYRYASINLDLLQKNLGNVDRKSALEVAAHLVHMLATIVPEAKQNVFAAYNLADYVMVSFGKIPVSGANAFEEPVRRDLKKGYINPSIQAFEQYIDRVRSGYGLDEKQAAFTLWQSVLEPALPSLDALKNWVRSNGQEI